MCTKAINRDTKPSVFIVVSQLMWLSELADLLFVLVLLPWVLLVLHVFRRTLVEERQQHTSRRSVVSYWTVPPTAAQVPLV